MRKFLTGVRTVQNLTDKTLNATKKTDGERLSAIYVEIEEALWQKPIDVKTNLTEEGFRAACKIMMDALIDKMWEKQDKLEMPQSKRLEMVKYFGESFRMLIKQATDIDPHEFYKP